MMNIVPHDGLLGASVTGLDLSRPLGDQQFAQLFNALGDRGVLHFPNQPISADALRSFSARFGSLQIIKGVPYHEPGLPEVTILSNVVENGQPIGLADAGQSWHTDMTYNATVGFVNVLVAHRVPVRNGHALGATEFASTQAAFEALDPALISLRGRTRCSRFEFLLGIHATRKGLDASAPHRSAAAGATAGAAPGVAHSPHHGATRHLCEPWLYRANRRLPADQSEALLTQIYDHVLQPRFRYTHRWQVGDVLMWDHLGTWHNAVADYEADEPRLMKRCQVLADKVFDPTFTSGVLAAA